MDLGDCYRLLGLRSGACFADIKASYRRLAQQYHPDINPGDTKAKEKFIAVTEAYKLLLQVIPQEETAPPSSHSPAVEYQPTKVTRKETATKEKPKEKPKPKPPSFSEIEQRFKVENLRTFTAVFERKTLPPSDILGRKH
jgi:hypothetical protein